MLTSSELWKSTFSNFFVNSHAIKVGGHVYGEEDMEDRHIEEYRRICRDALGIDISLEQAHEEGQKLLNLMSLLMKTGARDSISNRTEGGQDDGPSV